MNKVSVSRSWLACVAVAVACSCLSVSARTIAQFRYAEWAVVDREMLDSLLLALPVTTLLSLVTARIWFTDGLPWLLPHQPRARTTAVRDAVATGVAAAVGLLLGWLPVLVWGVWTSTYGHPSIVSIAGVLVWIIAASVLSIAVTVMTRSIWPAIVLSLVWVAVFVIGRMDPPARSVPATRLSILPFDGVHGGVYAPLHQNLAISLVRLVGAVLVLSAAIVALRRVLNDGTRLQRIRAGLAHWPALVVIAIIAASMTHTIPIATTTHQPLQCTDGVVHTCVYASHAADLSVAAAIANRLARNTNGLFSARLVSEEKVPDKAVATINVYPDLTNDPATDIAQQLRDFTLGPNGCSEFNPGQNPAVARLLDRWLNARASGTSPDTSGLPDAQALQLRHWNSNPSKTNAGLRAIWPQIQRCNLSLKDLPR